MIKDLLDVIGTIITAALLVTGIVLCAMFGMVLLGAMGVTVSLPL